MPESPEAGRAAGPHRDAVNRELAVPGEQRRREILDADARSAGHDDHVGVGVERIQDRIGFVGDQTRKVDETSVALDEGGEHRPVGVDDLIAVRLRAGRQQLVAGHDQPDPRPAEHATPLPRRPN